jgi:NAD(P)-dependent dehydrogenase (short-subunit alcohol dehydrogenase family)
VTQKTWFITGTSSGFGHEWAAAALERGDNVAASARDPSRVSDLVDRHGDRVLAVKLDVTDRAAVFEAVNDAHEHFGRLDVIVNNAGYGQYGMVEELSEQEARAQFETNFFGALWVVQAALPLLREQGGGHLLQISSIGGHTSSAGLGIYHASKWAMEAISQALAQEVAGFGVRVTLIEPGGYRTSGERNAPYTTKNPVYQDGHQAIEARRSRASLQPDPATTRQAILAVVDSANPPLRVLLADGGLDMVAAEYESRLNVWRSWQATAPTEA